MMYGDPQQQQHQQHQHQQQQHHQQPPGGGGDHFHRGPPLQQPPGPPMMRQPSASSTTLNPSDYHHPSANPPYDAHGDSFTAKRMRKLTQRRAVDYTSTVVRYMQQSAKVLTPEMRTVNEDWTIVLPRRGRKGRNLPRIRTPEEQQKPWFPTELVSDPHRESKLLQKMQTCIKKLESSEFYQTFMNQIQTPEILNRFYSVLGSELKMQMVIYGIGSIESYETPRLQLSLAILMKRKLNWIGDVEVFDPILSATESRVLESFGCSVLSVNEQGRRCAIKPTLFYMPHCEAELYDNLLQANQGVTLKGIVLLGNSFETYEQHVSEYKSSVIVDTARHVLAVRKFTQEFSIKTVSDDYFAAFHDSSWHFFSPDVEAELQLTEI